MLAIALNVLAAWNLTGVAIFLFRHFGRYRRTYRMPPLDWVLFLLFFAFLWPWLLLDLYHHRVR